MYRSIVKITIMRKRQYLVANVRLKGKKITYIETGKRNGKSPLLMIPGWPISVISLLPLMKLLGLKFWCIALNLPGYGSSETNSKHFHSFDFYSEFIQKFKEQVLQTKKVNFFGHSTGGVHGLNYALNYANSLNKLIIFSPPFNGVEQLEKTAKQYKSAIYLFYALKKWPRLIYLFQPKKIRYFIANWLFKLFYIKRYPDIASLDREFVQAILIDTCNFNAKAIFDNVLHLSLSEFDKLAHNLKKETLVIAAENDHAVSAKDSKRLANLLVKGEFIEIPKVGHDVVITQPHLVANHIIDFIG